MAAFFYHMEFVLFFLLFWLILPLKIFHFRLFEELEIGLRLTSDQLADVDKEILRQIIF